MSSCSHCKKFISDEELDMCHTCSDGKDNCDVALCLECEHAEWSTYFEYAGGYLDICKPCFITRTDEIKQRWKNKTC